MRPSTSKSSMSRCLAGIAALGLVLISSVANAEWCAPGVKRQPPHPLTGETCPLVGSMGGAKLAIPTEYLLGPVAYKGIDIWSAESFAKTPKHPTFSSEIDNFSIKIRQSNFKPIESASDFSDYIRSYNAVKTLPPPDNRWIHVGFGTRYYPTSAKEVAERWHEDEAHWGPYERAANVWGLAHFVSVQQPSTNIPGDQVEYFYSLADDSTFIFCRSTLMKVPPHNLLTRCEINFDVPQMKARAEVTNIRDKADLARWREIEAGVLGVAGSFIVQ